VQPNDPQAQEHPYLRWADIARALEAFKPPEMNIDDDGEVVNQAWVFRGLKSASYHLEPTIEREAQSKSVEWPALELLVSSEFKSRARLHLNALPVPEDEFSWLALMQHFAVPTRLLDFTYSPFVALYFAVRNRSERQSDIRVWAIDERAVNNRFTAVARQGLAEERKRQRMRTDGRVGTAFEDLRTSRDSMTTETDELPKLIAQLLSYPSTCRGVLHEQGCVCVASPPAFNPRLASQQGVFLTNFAEDLSFEQSLFKMMEPCRNWYKTFGIAADAVPISEIQQRLFQMNIHEQSLFPDMEGLAGLIRQKISLHWK
jgi:hypothetical protein